MIPVGLIKDDKSYVLSSILPTRYNKEETNTITNKYYEENAIVHLVGRWIMYNYTRSTGTRKVAGVLTGGKFTQEKLNTMLFSTVVDPHWFQKGNNFWFQYKTSEGTFWYVVDPSARSKKQLFDRDEMASQLTEIVKDPFEARHLPIRNLKAQEDGRTFTFEVVSSQDAKPKKEDKEKKIKRQDRERSLLFFLRLSHP